MMTLDKFDTIQHGSLDFYRNSIRLSLVALESRDRESLEMFAAAALPFVIDRDAGPKASSCIAFEYAKNMLAELHRRIGGVE